jgi:hypothetical protein
VKTKCSETFNDIEEEENNQVNEGSINSLKKYNYTVDLSKRKKPMLMKFGSAEYSMTPKTQIRFDFYQKTIEDFNASKSTSPKTFTHKKRSLKTKLKDL